ncbi:hypothetical protein [Sporisorium scitamineum]|uniref:Uncharacterized protein n=1 Tax=Sporisorium scitamineum TaxID=49012 RepID=A0A0F7S8K8_9BASI|nr:hypothetical protein [Sporisorium scitamineum]
MSSADARRALSEIEVRFELGNESISSGAKVGARTGCIRA